MLGRGQIADPVPSQVIAISDYGAGHQGHLDDPASHRGATGNRAREEAGGVAGGAPGDRLTVADEFRHTPGRAVAGRQELNRVVAESNPCWFTAAVQLSLFSNLLLKGRIRILLHDWVEGLCFRFGEA